MLVNRALTRVGQAARGGLARTRQPMVVVAAAGPMPAQAPGPKPPSDAARAAAANKAAPPQQPRPRPPPGGGGPRGPVKPQQEDRWPKLIEARNTGEVVEAKITQLNEGGAVVMVEGQRRFIPYKAMDQARLRQGQGTDMNYLIGQPVRAKVVTAEVKEGRRQLVLSERRVAQSQALAKLTPGTVLSGSVTGIEDYGAFVSLSDIPDVQGLVHKDEVSWSKVITVDRFLQIGQKVQVQVLNVDAANTRLSLSIKRLSPDPLTTSLDDMDWGPLVHAEPVQISALIAALSAQVGVAAVLPTRQLLDATRVAQEVEVYLCKSQPAGSSKLSVIARINTLSTELEVQSDKSREELKALLQALVKSA